MSTPAAQRRPTPLPVAALLLLLAAALPPGLTGCAQGPEEAAEPVAAEPTRIENEEMGLAVVLPAGSPFEPVSNEGNQVRLRFPETPEFSEGTVIYTVEPEQDYGVNLHSQVNQRKTAIEEMPEGEFLGQLAIGHAILGNAFSTRGRYVDENGDQVEEIRIFAVHPESNYRLVHMTYRYQPSNGQTKVRMEDQAFEAFGYLEPLATPTTETPAPEPTREPEATQ